MLAIVKKVAETKRGDIYVRSASDEGTTFPVEISLQYHDLSGKISRLIPIMQKAEEMILGLY